MAYAGDGTGLDLDGSNEYVKTATSSALNMGGSSYTIEIWVWGDNSLSYASERMLVEYTNDWGEGAYQLTSGNDSHFKTNFYGRDSDQGSECTTDWTDSSWHHLVGVLDTASNVIRTYIDGELCDTTAEIEAPDNVDGPLYIGARGDIGGGSVGLYSDVMIDEVRIWDTALTQATLQAWMHREVTSNHPDYTNLAGYWKLDDGSGSTATDSDGSANGTLYNMENGDWVSISAPVGTVANHKNDLTAMWSSQTNTNADDVTTGLDIADVAFLNDVGDDIVFGHDNSAFGWVASDLSTTPNASQRWARVWELDVNDQSGTSGGSVDLTFDISDAGGSGDFSTSTNYYLLKRAAGSSDDFTEVSVTDVTVVGDQVTFRVDAANLGSEFTIGEGSTTALALRDLTVLPSTIHPLRLLPGLVALVTGAAALIWRRAGSEA
jgi:hypothetical protein